MSMPLRVLFVEDVEEDAELIARELKRGGFAPDWQRVDSAAAMEEALQIGKWDIIISDYAIPGFGGIAALELLKQSGLAIPFIIVSGAIGEQTAVEAMKAGAHDYFLKGQITRLPVAVERELREATARRKQRAGGIALRDMQARFHAFMSNAPMPAWIKDAELRYVYANPAQANFFNLTLDEIIGRDDFDLLSSGAAQNAQANDRRALQLKLPTGTQETVMNGRNQQQILDIVRFPLTGIDDQSLVAGLAIDVTERVNSQRKLEIAIQKLQLLSSRIIEVQEQERGRLARGLHDDVGQSLTALKINLEMTAKAHPGVMLAPAVEIVAAVLAQVRTLSLDLRPPQLDNLGLVSALRWYVEKQAASAGMEVGFEGQDLPGRPHHDIENTCFRIVQEAVTNMLRHAQATRLSVSIGPGPEPKPGKPRIAVRIRDNGRGFDIDKARENAVMGQSSGLLNMEERALLVGGRLEIFSQPGRGVEINLLLPLTPNVHAGDEE
jgi:two-component system sensor histidine kinase UhpB